ncbi:MAG TPA: hypothetical protein VF916_00660 [Ktedonobacterales bacterium]
MSWTISVPAVPASEFEAAVDRAVATGEDSSEHAAQIEVAKEMAKRVHRSGALGHGGSVGVTLSGHANAHHEARAGFANDHLSINLYRNPPEPTPEK